MYKLAESYMQSTFDLRPRHVERGQPKTIPTFGMRVWRSGCSLSKLSSSLYTPGRKTASKPTVRTPQAKALGRPPYRQRLGDLLRLGGLGGVVVALLEVVVLGGVTFPVMVKPTYSLSPGRMRPSRCRVATFCPASSKSASCSRRPANDSPSPTADASAVTPAPFALARSPSWPLASGSAPRAAMSATARSAALTAAPTSSGFPEAAAPRTEASTARSIGDVVAARWCPPNRRRTRRGVARWIMRTGGNGPLTVERA